MDSRQAIEVINTQRNNPIASSPTRVAGSQFTTEQKRAYLAGLSHTDLVNLLLHISNSGPDLPIFPSNLLELRASVFFPSSTIPPTTVMTGITPNAANSLPSAVSNTTANSGIAPNISGHGYPSLPGTGTRAARREDITTDDEDEYVHIEEHRLYPKPGNGFCLPADSEDLDMLLEDPGCATFSYALHGPATVRAESKRLRVVDSVA
jgi:hypothetical protein